MEAITEILERNAREWPNDVALVEINPQELEKRNTTWREYSLIESSPLEAFRSEITWAEFDEKANRFANFLLSRGLKRGDKVVTGKYAGQELKLDGEDYVIVKMADILAVVE